MSIPTLASYSLLGRSGLRVSPLCLGTMTFGTEWGFGSPRDTVFDLLARYLDAGGNFIDTADGYTGGTSEKLIGEFLKDSGRRDGVVLATKFSFNVQPGDPNAGGNSRKHIRRALDASLKRLQTDYVDLYWLHAWDGLTPVEEVMSTLDAPARSATSACRTSRPGTSRAPRRSPSSAAASGSPGSSSSTRWSNATSSASTSPPRWPSASACARGARSAAAC
jgi:hypothetical protein